MTLPSVIATAVKGFIVIIVTFCIFLLMRHMAGDVGGMPTVFREAYAESVFVRTGTFIPAIVTMMSLILLHLLVNFSFLQEHMRLPPAIRGAVYGLLFGILWFIGFLELVVVYDSSLERHAQSGVRDLVTLTGFGVITGLLFARDVRSSNDTGLAADAGMAAIVVAAPFALFHWIQYSLTLEPIEQHVDDVLSVLWLLTAGGWVGVMYAFLGNQNLRPTARVLFFAINTFGINWLLYTAFYLLFLDMPVADTVLRCAFDVVGVILGLLVFERFRSRINLRRDRTADRQT